jgi:hypothetical protein
MPSFNAAASTLIEDERRHAERFPVDDEAEVEVVGDSTFMLSGFLRDVTPMGLRLALPERVSPGASITISLRGGYRRLTGEVRYCRSAGDIYYAGVVVHAISEATGQPRPQVCKAA